MTVMSTALVGMTVIVIRTLFVPSLCQVRPL